MQILNLSPSQPNLIGAYTGNHVIVLCDTTTEAFTVIAPDAFSSQDVLFEIVNVGNKILTVQTIKSQSFFINYNETFSLTVNPTNCLRITSAKTVGKYIVLQLPGIMGNYPAGNYAIFEDSGFLEFNGTGKAHEDLNFDVLNSGGNPTTIPDYVEINNIACREFTSANNQRCSGWKENFHAAYIDNPQTLIPHCHIFLKSGESSGTTGVTFTLYWELRQETTTTNGSVAVSATSAQLAANANKINLYAATGFNGPTELGAQLGMTIARTGGDAGDVIATTYGVHVEIDSNGSRTATSK